MEIQAGAPAFHRARNRTPLPSIHLYHLTNMKKTLITFLALAGVASASIEGNWDSTISRDGSSLSFTNLPENSPITLSFVSSSITGYKSPNLTHDEQNLSTTYTPDTNVGTGNPWSLTFTITNSTENETFYLTHFCLDTFTFTGGGKWQNNDRTINLTLRAGENVIGTGVYRTDSNNNGIYSENINGDGNKSDTTQSVFIYTGGSNLQLEANESITLTLTATNPFASGTCGTYVGMSGVTVRTEYVPEPATATLSLLALCGLAARRRRK